MELNYAPPFINVLQSRFMIRSIKHFSTILMGNFMQTTEMALLKTRRFLPLFITQFLGAMNDNLFKNALVILITYKMVTSSSQLLVILSAGIFILPFFLFSAMAGQLADRYEKSRLIVLVKMIEIILMIVGAIGFYSQNNFILMLVLFGLGTHATFFGPLKYAILPEKLNENELIGGNGLIEAGTFLAILFGTILGGVLILAPHGEFFISVLMIGMAISGFIASGYIPRSEHSNPSIKLNFNIIQETRKLIHYSKQRWDIYLTILGISWFWLFGATFLSEFPVFAKETLHANEHIVTLFLTLFSIGLALGSLICNRLLKEKVNATYVPLAAIGMTLFTIDLYFASKQLTQASETELITLMQFLFSKQGIHICLDLMMIAICGGIYTVPLYTILQHRTEEAHRARVIASNNVMNALFMVIASMATMLMLKLGFSVPAVFLTLAIVNGFVAMYICKLLPDVMVRGFFRWLLTSLYRVKVKGLENYFHAGERVVILANHTSFIDALLLSVFLPDKLTFAINTHTAKNGWIRFFLSMVDAFSVDPTNPMALKSLIDFIKQDKRCVIFPEGRLTVTGALMKIYEGPGLVADKSDAVLLPIRIEGAQSTPFSRMRGKIRIRWMPSITLTIFPPQKLDIPEEIKGRKRRQKIGYRLYDIMTEIMFESSDYKKTVFHSLIDAKSIYGSHYKIIEDIDRVPISYQQFITRCFILGNYIAKSTHRSEVVGILLPNSITTAITFFALHAFNRIPAMLNYSTGAHNVKIACKTAEIKTVYTSRKFIHVGKLEDMIDALKEANIKLVYLEDLRSKLGLLDKIKGMLLAQFPRFSYNMINPSDNLNPENPGVILFTSGSEGTPKGVVLSHINLQANRNQMATCIDFTSNDKVFNALPVFHSFGLTAGMLLPLLSGVRLFLYPSPLHFRIIPELSYDISATIFFGTDTFLSGYAKYAHQYDFYSIRYVFAGAEKLRDETRLLWSQKFGVRVFEGYGTTETSPVLSTNTPMQSKVGSVGRLLPSIRYQLKPVPGINEGGVLTISGPNVMKGYLLADQPGVIVPPPGGWYETGDVVEMDENGFVTIKGRVKRFAKIAGEMVSLTLIEQLIHKLWPEHQHAVINLPDAKKGEQIILATTNPEALREEVITHMKAHKLGEITIPKKIIFLEKIALLGSGKVDYSAVKDCVLDVVM